MNSAVSQQLLADFAAGDDVFPHQYMTAPDQILLVRLSGHAVREASFLDERVLPANAQGAWFAAAAVERAGESLPAAPVSYLFHAGHCGSTLASRLLGAASDAAGLREPLPLRALAFDAAEGGGALLSSEIFETRLGLFERSWARGAPGAVIKATSICTGLAAQITKRDDRRAVYLAQKPQTHLAVLLAGKNAVGDLRAFAQMRWRRLNAFMPMPPLAEYSVGELAALAWLAETAAAQEAGLVMFDFDRLLASAAETVAALAAALNVDAPQDRIDAAVSGPILRQYSKAPDHAYDAGLRAEIIAKSQIDHGAEIRKGMAWLGHMAGDSPAARACLDRWA